jgi:hypothetical protein
MSIGLFLLLFLFINKRWLALAGKRIEHKGSVVSGDRAG